MGHDPSRECFTLHAPKSAEPATPGTTPPGANLSLRPPVDVAGQAWPPPGRADSPEPRGKAPAGPSDTARARGRSTYQQLAAGGPPTFDTPLENLAAAACILNETAAPEDPALREVYDRVRFYLGSALQRPEASLRPQQSETKSNRQSQDRRSSARDSPVEERRPRHHAGSVLPRLGPNLDVRGTIDARRQARSELRDESRRRRSRDRYYRRGSLDSRSPSPEGVGPRAFGSLIRHAKFPQRFRAPTTIGRYNGETNPVHWLEDYRLACRTGGADDLFAIQYLPLFLTDSARGWLEHLPEGCVQDWSDLRRVFVGNF